MPVTRSQARAQDGSLPSSTSSRGKRPAKGKTTSSKPAAIETPTSKAPASKTARGRGGSASTPNLATSTASSFKTVKEQGSSNLIGSMASASKPVGGSSSNLVTALSGAGAVASSSKPMPPPQSKLRIRAKLPSAKPPTTAEVPKSTILNDANDGLQSNRSPTPSLPPPSEPITSVPSIVPAVTAPPAVTRPKVKVDRKKNQQKRDVDLRKFLTEMDNTFSGADTLSLIKQVDELQKQNTKEMEALLVQTLDESGRKDDGFKNSPMMVSALKNTRRVAKGKPGRVIGTPAGYKRPSLRISTLKDSATRVTRSKVKVRALNLPAIKRIRSPDTDAESPLRLTQNDAPKITFIQAITKQPKKKLKERKKRSKVASTQPAKIANTPTTPPVVETVVPQIPTPATTATSTNTVNVVNPMDATFVVEAPAQVSVATQEPPKTVVVEQLSTVLSPTIPIHLELATSANRVPVDTASESALLSSVVNDLSVLVLDDEVPDSSVLRSKDLGLMPPPTSRFSTPAYLHSQTGKENKETYEITMLADYDEDAYGHRVDKVVPAWAQDQLQIDYLLYRFSPKFMRGVTEFRTFPHGNQYTRFYPSGAPPRVRPPVHPASNNYRN